MEHQTKIRTDPVVAQHVTIACLRPFEEVQADLEARVPHLQEQGSDMLRQAETDAIADEWKHGPKLYIFTSCDHGSLLAAEGRHERAIQYGIGNPFTAENMTRIDHAASLYAPVREVLLDGKDGVARFTYDLPSSLFCQIADTTIISIAQQLDKEVASALPGAAG